MWGEAGKFRPMYIGLLKYVMMLGLELGTRTQCTTRKGVGVLRDLFYGAEPTEVQNGVEELRNSVTLGFTLNMGLQQLPLREFE
jgi:hypothetical protein